MNWRAISAIMRKDLTVALHSKPVVMPLIIVPMILMFAMPVVVGGISFFALRTGISTSNMQDLSTMVPPAVRDSVAGLNDIQAGLVFALVYLFAPMYLIIPLMVSSVIAADSFAGEKERRTLEAIVYTPTTDRELLFAKILGGWVPGILVSLGSFLLYTTVVDIVSWQVIGRPLLPNAFWLLLAFWVSPAAAGLGLGITVLVSSRVSTFQEAYQMGSLIVLPLVFLMIGQIAGLFYLNVWTVFAVGLVFWLLDIAIFFFGAATFKRSEIMARLP